MGKRIIQQARGHGSHTYRVRRKAFSIKPGYLPDLKNEEELTVVKLVASGGHSTPLAKLKSADGKVFFNFAVNLLYEGQKIKIGRHEAGDIAMVGDLSNGTKIFNIENKPKDGGRFVKSGGSFATVMVKKGNQVTILMPSKKEKKLDSHCRATIGVAAGGGRLEKPILKAGKKFYIMKTKSKLWPRTSAVAMNAIDHPFGSGRGKRIKSKIAKRNSPPGRKVGLLRPRRTGRKKR
ncbi:50S ribosomal protein L2 [Candidatus Pacearchaeota archaeon]|nr:50S ribosomal protein L2 [Candidatus Pacearchaeota archaeon]